MISSSVEQPCTDRFISLQDCHKSSIEKTTPMAPESFNIGKLKTGYEAANESQLQEALTEDQIWVQKFQSGDKKVFDLLVRKYERRLRNMISKIIFQRDDVEDVLQETWLNVYKALRNFRGDAQFYSWLYRIAQNTAITAVKKEIVKKKAFESNFLDQDVEAEAYNESSPLNLTNPSYSPEEHLLDGQLKHKLEEGIQKLSQDLRDTFIFREQHGLSYQQIANIQLIPIGTVRSRINRAREIITGQSGLEDINLVIQ